MSHVYGGRLVFGQVDGTAQVWTSGLMDKLSETFKSLARRVEAAVGSRQAQISVRLLVSKVVLIWVFFYCWFFWGEREMFYLMTHSTHFIYGYMASDIWLRTILIVRKETRCHHIGYSYQLTARVLLYAPSPILFGEVLFYMFVLVFGFVFGFLTMHFTCFIDVCLVFVGVLYFWGSVILYVCVSFWFLV